MTRILLMFLFLSSPSFAANIHHSTKALAHLTKCLPSHSMSCVVGANGCTDAQFCAACTALADADPSSCSDKPYAFAGLEGLYGKVEGSCLNQCGEGAVVQSVRTRHSTSGGDELVLIDNLGQGGLASKSDANGTVLMEISYDGPRKSSGDILKTSIDSIAQPIMANTLCLRGNTNTNISGCLASGKDCGKLFAKKTTRCAACTTVSSCPSDFLTMFRSMYSVNLCSGC